MSIYLYIKQHTVTGKLYFGKTNSRHPEKYLGSGKLWTRHTNKHGKEHVVNLWYGSFDSQEECTVFALEFSHKMNIVESDQWLNLIPENGLDGAVSGLIGPNKDRKFSNETKEKMSISKTGTKASIETKQQMSDSRRGSNNSFFGKTHSEETKAKIRATLLAKKLKS